MEKQQIFQVDAFTIGQAFSGNPASVVPLESWPSDSLLHKIAMENNQAETAFFVKEPEGYHLRWFTPAVEVDLCGHATLAASHVLYTELGYDQPRLSFASRSGTLTVEKNEKGYTLDFPADTLKSVLLTNDLLACFDLTPSLAFKGKTDYMLVFESQEEIVKIRPDLNAIAKIDARGLIITAPGLEVDFVSRFFAPQSGINEDPVTGSAHTSLTPYWSARLGRQELMALQLSPRLGQLYCVNAGNRVKISGNAKTYLRGEIFV